MARSVHTRPSLYEALKAEGFELPRNCGDVQLIAPVDGAMALHYTQFLEPDDLEKVGKALVRMSGSQHEQD